MIKAKKDSEKQKEAEVRRKAKRKSTEGKIKKPKTKAYDQK